MKIFRVLIVAVALAALDSRPSLALVFQVSAPTMADIEAAAQMVPGLWSPDAQGPAGDIPAHINTDGAQPNGWTWVPAQGTGGGCTWYVQSGTTTDQFGNQVPNMVPKDSNCYGLLDWNGDISAIPLPGGVSIVTGSQTVNGIPMPTYTITIPMPDGYFVMSSPPDPTFPLHME